MKRDFSNFKSFIYGKKVAVVGIGVSNTPLIKMLVNLGAKVTACDKKNDIGELGEEFSNIGVNLKLGEDYLEGVLYSEVVFRTPSLLPTNEYLIKAREKGIVVTSEMEEFIKYCPCKIFGVTGSDGKTTTTTLIGEMLKKQGYRVFVGGNIGTPLFTEIENINKDDFVVIELSSFQLMDIDISPEVSVITNLSPNHLDYHRNMEEYVDAKKNIYKYQNENGIVILNRDNDITNSMTNEIKGKTRLFSLKDKEVFSHLEGEALICEGKSVCSLEDIVLPGMHNVENLLAAFSAVSDLVTIDTMREIATSFKGVEHRIEFVREINKVKFYNDSIASSPARTIAGLKSFKQKVILIAGGYYKNIPFEELAAEGLERIKILILMGNTKKMIKEAFEKEAKRRNKEINIIEAESLEDAVSKAYQTSEPNDIVTMSPACASFDMFKNFEVRGNAFKDIVNNLAE